MIYGGQDVYPFYSGPTQSRPETGERRETSRDPHWDTLDKLKPRVGMAVDSLLLQERKHQAVVVHFDRAGSEFDGMRLMTTPDRVGPEDRTAWGGSYQGRRGEQRV